MNEKNQCDGCQRGLKLVDGMHKIEGTSYGWTTCTKDRYVTPQEGKKCGNDGKTMWCYCGKCKQEDYPLPEDFKKMGVLRLGPGYKVTPQDLINQAFDEYIAVYKRIAGDDSRTGTEAAIALDNVKKVIARVFSDISPEEAQEKCHHGNYPTICGICHELSSSDWKEKAISMICAFRTGSMDRDQFKANVEHQIEKIIEAEREEQNRINNSGRKLYQIGYDAALEAVKKMLEELKTSIPARKGKRLFLDQVAVNIHNWPIEQALAALSSLKTE